MFSSIVALEHEAPDGAKDIFHLVFLQTRRSYGAKTKSNLKQEVGSAIALPTGRIIHLNKNPEILSGLFYKDARRQQEKFLEFSKVNRVILLSMQATMLAAEWQARLRREEQSIGHTDTLMAGIAIANDFQLITNNTEHFRRIPDLKIANRSKPSSVK